MYTIRFRFLTIKIYSEWFGHCLRCQSGWIAFDSEFGQLQKYSGPPRHYSACEADVFKVSDSGLGLIPNGLDTIWHVNQGWITDSDSGMPIWVLNIDLMPSNLTSPHLPDYVDAHTGLLLLINLYHCIEDLYIYISSNLFSNCRRYIKWYHLNGPYIANIRKCELYIHLFQSNYARATWRFGVPVPLPHMYHVVAQDTRILWCYNPNNSFYI